jgi:hypothetical protein
MVGVPRAFGTGLVDLGPAGGASWDSNIGNDKPSFAVHQAGTLDNGSTPFVDVTPAATITGSAGSFQATVPQSGDMQFYQIRHP